MTTSTKTTALTWNECLSPLMLQKWTELERIGIRFFYRHNAYRVQTVAGCKDVITHETHSRHEAGEYVSRVSNQLRQLARDAVTQAKRRMLALNMDTNESDCALAGCGVVKDAR